MSVDIAVVGTAQSGIEQDIGMSVDLAMKYFKQITAWVLWASMTEQYQKIHVVSMCQKQHSIMKFAVFSEGNLAIQTYFLYVSMLVSMYLW